MYNFNINFMNNNNKEKGHRQRIFNKFFHGDGKNLDKVDIIEIFLFFSIPRKDVRKIAYELINKYEYIYKIISLPKEELLQIIGINNNTYIFFRIILIIIQYMHKEQINTREKFFSMEHVIEYCKWKMCFLNYEEVRILYFDNKNKLIKDEVIHKGTTNFVYIHTKEIIKRTLQLGACSLIVCHNHPSGDSSPSQEDINSTLDLKKICEYLQINLIDHIIIGGKCFYSMKQNNLL
ncbi:hypothetical protein AB836_01755 [Rickettsiales bacterium (ex Bugula neritina AB1)]|nr:hypothetical protein AB836_01755 [Rickettsiales bacterium (ex Bugula neritina AB1)]